MSTAMPGCAPLRPRCPVMEDLQAVAAVLGSVSEAELLLETLQG
ncbi:hypothetical protein [Stenotrophomonas sp. GZD-301]